MMDTTEFKAQLEKVLESTRESLSTIRTGRVSGALVENIQVLTYGGQATLRVIELGTIATNGPQELVIVPFDPSVLQDIEKALRTSALGFSVSVDGHNIRVKMPPMSEEQRQKYVKLVAEFAENAREAIRRRRDEVRKNIKQMFEDKELSEDGKFTQEQEVDKVSKDFNEKIEQMREKKEEEVMTV